MFEGEEEARAGRVTNVIKNYTAHQDEESNSGKHLTNLFGKQVLRKFSRAS